MSLIEVFSIEKIFLLFVKEEIHKWEFCPRYVFIILLCVVYTQKDCIQSFT